MTTNVAQVAEMVTPTKEIANIERQTDILPQTGESLQSTIARIENSNNVRYFNNLVKNKIL